MLELNITSHAVDRYLDGVADSAKHTRTDEEIREIIRNSISNSSLPKKIPSGFHYLAELNDPESKSSFGFYYFILRPSKELGYKTAVVTIKHV